MHWSRSETLQAQIDGREQEKRTCSEERAAAQQKIDRLAAEVQQKEAQRQEYIRKSASTQQDLLAMRNQLKEKKGYGGF